MTGASLTNCVAGGEAGEGRGRHSEDVREQEEEGGGGGRDAAWRPRVGGQGQGASGGAGGVRQETSLAD